MTSSSPEFGQYPNSGPGYNMIGYSSYSLVTAENSSVACCFGYGTSTAGSNSFYQVDFPTMRASNYSNIDADNCYWTEGAGDCLYDGTCTFFARYPLAGDPNTNPLGKIAIATGGSSAPMPSTSGLTDDELVKGIIQRALSAGYQGNLTQARDSLVWVINNEATSVYAPLALLVWGRFSGMRGDEVNADKSVKIESDFQNRLKALAATPKETPLRPHAIRLLARSAALMSDPKTADQYSQQLVDEYPGTVHEMVSQYDLLVSAIEVDQDYPKAQKILETLKIKFPDSDLTTSAKMLCGEKVMPGSPKESDQAKDVAADNELNAAYPNPFNPSTCITFSLKSDSRVRLTVFDILGREAAKLSDGVQSAGQHSVVWNAKSVTSGVYFARLEVTDLYGKSLFTKTAKLVMTK